MATTTKGRYDARSALYAYLGAGQLLVDKTREFGSKAWALARRGREGAIESYKDLAARGEKLAKSIQRSSYTKQALEQSKVARSQVKAAATSVRKAVNSTADATRAAAKKVS
jgi:NAD+--asparagine ADP-ribosyltransferase